MLATGEAAAGNACKDVGCELPGVLRVVVRGAAAADLRAVARDIGGLGILETRSSGDVPTFEISFVDGMSTSTLRRLDGGSVGYGGSGMYAFAGHHTARAFLQQGTAWGAGSIVCTRELRRIPFLAAAIDLASLAAGWAPLHASAWVTPDGVGVIASGWAHSGKTGSMLAAYEHGARLVGDDRVLLSPNGDLAVGLGRPVQVKDWHVAQLPRMREAIGGVRGTLLRAGFAVASRRKVRGRSSWGRLFDRALTKARDAWTVELALPAAEDGGQGLPAARPHLLLLMETHDDPRILAEPADPDSVAPRLAAHVRADLIPTLRAQLAYEYAHPDTGWQGVDRAPRMAASILERAVRGTPAWIVRHPYPCSLERLHAVISELAASPA